ncbi:MAG: hypothetical protein IKD90_01230, partial [Clostridiales bacterium]|nr:hypothetical protein [Clostridiales bacterium]
FRHENRCLSGKTAVFQGTIGEQLLFKYQKASISPVCIVRRMGKVLIIPSRISQRNLIKVTLVLA